MPAQIATTMSVVGRRHPATHAPHQPLVYTIQHGVQHLSTINNNLINIHAGPITKGRGRNPPTDDPAPAIFTDRDTRSSVTR